MSQGDFKGGQFAGSRPLSPWERARILPREGFEAKFGALGFLVLGNLGYSLYYYRGGIAILPTVFICVVEFMSQWSWFWSRRHG